MRKIILITLTLAPYKVKWMEHLADEFDVHIYFTRDFDIERNPNWLIKSSIKVNLIKGYDVISMKFYKLHLFKYIWRFRNDVLIFDGYGFLTQFIGILMCRILGIKHFINVDGGIKVQNENVILRFIKRILISKKSYYLASSEYTKEYLIDYGAKKENIYIHPFTSLEQPDILTNLIDCNYKKQLKNELNLDSKFQVLCVSQTIHRKGIDVLLESLSSIKNVHLTIIGGNSTEEYDYIINKNSLSVDFIDYLDYTQLRKFYQAVDLFVLPTRYDIWGLVINEAMANGLPVITTKKCGAGIALIDKEFLVETDNVNELSDRILKVQLNSKLREELSLQNLQRIQPYFIENVAKFHRNLFRN